MMNQDIHEAYRRILRSELIAAMGCTEPIAIAYAAALARRVLGKKPEHCVADCSGNIVNGLHIEGCQVAVNIESTESEVHSRIAEDALVWNVSSTLNRR